MKKDEIKVLLKELYKLYGFHLEDEEENILTFSYSAGYFYNVEIILLDKSDKCQTEAKVIEKNYNDIGYNNVVVHYYESIQSVHDKMFNAFFHLQESRKRLQNEYIGFCEKKTEKLLDEYTYIPCHYRDEKGEECNDLVTSIVKSAEKKEPKLTILEAAAGFGKTCTAYEILNTFLNNQKDKIPLFIELSKNRTARIFRHVLNDEIDRKFSQLSSEIVLKEIKDGRIPLIIDGFDELIEKKEEGRKHNVEEEIDERSLTLLSTISQLLGDDSKAWVLLTTRRSAIFTGDIFEEWILSHLGKKCIVRCLQIQMPSLKEWIGSERYELIQKGDIDIEKLSNPVLLTFIKNTTKEEFEKMVKTSDMILNKYFELLLERELQRQNLEFTKDELHKVMECLAAEFARYDVTSETIETIQDLLRDILKENLLHYRSDYTKKYLTEEGMLTEDEFVKRVSHNYLLDRISANSNQISFINEFIFGILVGDAVVDKILDGEELCERFIDMAVTAFAVRGEKVRRDFYNKIYIYLEKLSLPCRLNVEMYLQHEINSDYIDGYFRNFYIKKDYKFYRPYRFISCTFDTCTFDGCKIQAEVFEDCKFVNCHFYNVDIEGTPNQNLIFMGGSGYEKLVVQHAYEETDESIDRYEKLVLEQFWKRGSDRAEMRRTYTALFRGTKSNEQKQVQNAINSLLKRELICELNVCYELNTTHMGEINHILGRK